MFVAVVNSVFTIISGIGEDDNSNKTMILGVLDLEATEESSVADQSNLALELYAKLDETLKVVNGTAT